MFRLQGGMVLHTCPPCQAATHPQGDSAGDGGGGEPLQPSQLA